MYLVVAVKGVGNVSLALPITASFARKTWRSAEEFIRRSGLVFSNQSLLQRHWPFQFKMKLSGNAWEEFDDVAYKETKPALRKRR